MIVFNTHFLLPQVFGKNRSTLAGMFSKSATTAVCDMLCMVKYI